MDPTAVERDLRRYYEQEAAERRDRAIDPSRVAARDEFIGTLPAGQRVLEIGIGPGRDAAAFVAAEHVVSGIDLAQAHAELASGAGASAAVATARALPYAGGAFDVVWTMSTLMHIPASAIHDALREIRRVLSSGGVAVIGVWGGADVEDVLPNLDYGPRLFSRRTDARWRELLQTIGAVERFETWRRADDDAFWYQFAVVTAG